MFQLSKVLPLLVLPLGLALLLLGWGIGRGGRWPAPVALALLWFFATPLVAEGLWRWLERPFQRWWCWEVAATRPPGLPAPASGSTPTASSAAWRPTGSCAARTNAPA
jgi:hypothetical protein